MAETYVAYVAHVDATTGHITRIQLANAVFPAEGISTSNDSERIVHIASDFEYPAFTPQYSQRSNFMEKYYWDNSTSSWGYRGSPPNMAGLWTGTEWTWNQDAWENHIRQRRDQLLSSTDWTQLPDVSLSEDDLSQVTLYRSNLRGLLNTITASPESYPTEESIPWPPRPYFL